MTEYNAGQIESLELSELALQPVSTKEEADEIPCENCGEGYILVAEDDKDVAFMITQMLKNQGYCFKWAANGKEAHELIKQSMPRLLITDVMMPEMDGLELTRVIREDEEHNHLPIIIVSARTSNNDRLAGIDAGAEVYLGKPFIPDELLLRVRKLLEQREILEKAYREEIRKADQQAQNELTQGLKNHEKVFIEKIDAFIHDNITECTLNAGMLADCMAMSITTLNRRISGITGVNTTNYIRLKRLTRAKFLLKNTEMSMGEIQAVCGFDSPSYFSRTFKGEFGVTPSEYRKS
jgi:CheY-like chemotaxis protein